MALLGSKPIPKKALDYPRLRLSSISYTQDPIAPSTEYFTTTNFPFQSYNFELEEKVLSSLRARRAQEASKKLAEQEARNVPPRSPVAAASSELKVHVAVEQQQQLTPVQSSTLEKFMSLTGVTNKVKAVELFQCVDWDLNNAIARYFDTGDIQKAIDISKRAPSHEVASTLKLALAFPDGSSSTAQFNITDTLWAVFYHVQESGKIQPVGRMVSFHVDQRIFTDAEFDQSLTTLGLTDNTSLRIVLA